MTTLSQVVRGAYRMLGLASSYPTTNGSTTTAVIGRFANEETPPEDDVFKNWTLIVDEADGAAPEGEWGNVSAYASGTYTVTCDTLTAAIASGDRVMLVQPTITLSDMIAAVNTALFELDATPLVDSSITLVSTTYLYNLPANVVNVLNVEYLPTGGDKRYKLNYEVKPHATVSGQLVLYVPVPDDGTLYVTYDGSHPAVNAYSDTISPTIPLQLIVAQTAHCVLRNISQKTPLWQEKYNIVVGELNAARTVKKQRRPMKRNPVLDIS